jgi:hypothetical protein
VRQRTTSLLAQHQRVREQKQDLTIDPLMPLVKQSACWEILRTACCANGSRTDRYAVGVQAKVITASASVKVKDFSPPTRCAHEVQPSRRETESVVIPKGSRLVGHVTEVMARSKDQATSVVGIAFDRAVLNNGTEMALGIQAIGRSMPPGESELASGTTTVAPGGLLGGVGSTTTGAASDVGSGARSAALAPGSQGVVGLLGLSLSSHTSA